MRLPATVVLLLLALCAPGRAEEWTTYTDREAGFSVSYPAGWEASSKPMPEAELKITAPGGTAPTICMVAYSFLEGYDQAPLDMALEAFDAKKFIKIAQEKYDDVRLLVNERRQISTKEAVYIEASYRNRTDEAEYPGLPFETQVYFTQVGSGSLLVSCVVPSEDMDLRVDTLVRIYQAFEIRP